jgi:hypothetical protein
MAVNFGFLDRSCYFSIQVAPQYIRTYSDRNKGESYNVCVTIITSSSTAVILLVFSQ